MSPPDDPAPLGLGPRGRLLAGLLLGLFVLAAALHAASFLGAGPCDDDFIVHRYARNWIDGLGLVFDAGEKVEGFTVPLWLFLSAAAQLAGLDPALASQALSILSAALAAACVGLAWSARFPDSRWPLPALLVAAAPTFAWHAACGLGTTLMAALLAGWVLAWESSVRGRRGALAADLCLAAACLLRQECALFLLPYAWSELRRGRRLAGLPALIALAGWTLFRLTYYGRWLPMTWSVKKLAPLDDLGYGARYLLRSTWECGLPIFALAALWGWLRARAAGRATAQQSALLLALTLHTAYVVWVGGDYMPWSRFFVPTLPLWIYTGCAALRFELRTLPAFGAVLALTACAAPQWLQFGWTIDGRPQRFGEHAFFEQRWAQLGRCFRERLPADACIAISPIGAFGFYSHLRIVDVLGLTQAGLEQVEPRLEITMKGHQRSDGRWVLAQNPDALILGNGVLQPPAGELVINPWERGIVEQPDFKQRYAAAWMEIPGSGPLVYFSRRDRPLPSGARWL